MFWLPAAPAAVPKIVAITPAPGATVDAATAEIRIEFDQDMDTAGYSLCGGGPAFPKINGTIRWQSPRVLVAPVQLQPGHAYEFSLNCASALGFKNASGETLPPMPVRFFTREAAAGTAAERETQNRRALATLRRTVDERYSYRDRVVKDWNALWQRAEKELDPRAEPLAWATQAGAILAAAEDGHFSFKVGETFVPTFRVNLRPNAEPARLAGLVPGWKVFGRNLAAGRFPDGTGYVLIGTWQGSDAEFAPLHAVLDELIRLGAPGLIVDVRANAGGDERHASAFASRFVTKTAVFARQRVRDPQAPGGWQAWQTREISPGPPAGRFTGKVAVLMGNMCYSSNESFLLMMRHGAGARLFGERSFGSSGNPQPCDLGNGVIALVPSWQAADPDSRLIEGNGVAPNEAAALGDSPSRDGVLDAARRWLEQR